MDILGDKLFVRALDSWLVKNDQASGKIIERGAKKLPQMFTTAKTKLYRGMIVDSDFMDKVGKGQGITLKGFSSWSKSKDVAVAFVNDPKYRTTAKTGTKVIIELQNPQQTSVVLDINSLLLYAGFELVASGDLDPLAMDSAIKEEEVIMKDVVVRKSMVKVVK